MYFKLMKPKVILVLSIITFLLSSCKKTTNQNPNILDSTNYKTSTERVQVLKNEIISKSDFNDAEFVLFNVNGFTKNDRLAIPGASSWDYKFVIKINPSDIDKWTEDFVKFDPKEYNLNWTKAITNNRLNNWKTKSQPEFYRRSNNEVILIVYRKESILFKRATKL